MRTALLFLLLTCCAFSASSQEIADVYEITATQRGKQLGKITFKLLPEIAPKHAAFVAARIAEGFYNGTAFHRVIPNFMIQGGDPNSISGPRNTWGTGGHSTKVQAEFSTTKKHLRGTISAARTSDPNSFSGQFFICVVPTPWLDGDYSIFGEVISGMDVADVIVRVPRDGADNPVDKVSMTIAAKTTFVDQDEAASQQFVVHTMPVYDELTVSVTQPAAITLYDLSGSIAAQFQAESGTSTHNTTSLPCGAYVIEAACADGTTMYRPILLAER